MKKKNSNIFAGHRIHRIVKYPSYLKKGKKKKKFIERSIFIDSLNKKKDTHLLERSPDDKYSNRRIVSARYPSLRHSDETPNNKSRHGLKKKGEEQAPFIPSACCSSFVDFERAAWKQRRSLTYSVGRGANRSFVDREMRIFSFLFPTPGFAWPGGDFVIENGETPRYPRARTPPRFLRVNKSSAPLPPASRPDILEISFLRSILKIELFTFFSKLLNSQLFVFALLPFPSILCNTFSRACLVLLLYHMFR